MGMVMSWHRNYSFFCHHRGDVFVLASQAAAVMAGCVTCRSGCVRRVVVSATAVSVVVTPAKLRLES